MLAHLEGFQTKGTTGRLAVRLGGLLALLILMCCRLWRQPFGPDGAGPHCQGSPGYGLAPTKARQNYDGKEGNTVNCEWPRVIFDSGRGVGRERYRFLGELATEAAKQGMTEAELLKTGKYIVVPCNKCLACKMRKSAEWAARAAQEAEYYPEGERWFVTLTYDEDNLPRYYASLGEVISGGNPIGGVPTLHHKDVQDFLKRIRDTEHKAAQKEGRDERKLKFLKIGRASCRERV